MDTKVQQEKGMKIRNPERIILGLGAWVASSAAIWLTYCGVLLVIEDARHQRASVMHSAVWLAIPIVSTLVAAFVSLIYAVYRGSGK